MKRSVINRAYRDALGSFSRHGWALPPHPRWDITDFGLGVFDQNGLVLLNLADEPEYSEKLMFARRGQATPCHRHARKKEDIICRFGELVLTLWPLRPAPGTAQPSSFPVRIDGRAGEVRPGEELVLAAGSRVTLPAGVWHSFWPRSQECIIGEVATRNDDAGDNEFLDPGVGRFPGIDEDEAACVRLIGD
jgi:D-lyxose ketol-isomerase